MPSEREMEISRGKKATEDTAEDTAEAALYALCAGSAVKVVTIVKVGR